MEPPAIVHVKIDPQVGRELIETAEREERKKNVIVERALRDYIARSKAEAEYAQKAAKSLTQNGQLTI